MNPTIRSLSLIGNTELFLKTVTKFLPNLEILLIDTLAHRFDDPERFDEFSVANVRAPKIKSSTELILENTTFPQLEDITMTSTPKTHWAWQTFLYKHKNLTKLTFTHQLNKNQLKNYSEKCPKLATVFVNCALDVDADTIITFVKQCRKLNTLVLENFSNAKNVQFLRDNLRNGTFISSTNIIPIKEFKFNERLN